MDLDNLFEQRNSRHNQNSQSYTRFRQNEDEYQDEYQERRNGSSHYASYLFKRIWSNTKLRLLFIVLTIILLTLITFITIALFPLLVKAYDFVVQNGANGVVDSGKGIVDKFLNGAGK